MKFNNPNHIEVTASFKDLLLWHKERYSKQKDLSFVVPQAINKEIPFLSSNRTETTITWIGHATFLIQISGLNILTDPVWSNRMGFSKRLAPPGLAISDLPEIHVVLLSHNHYDHLDFRSLRKIKGSPKCFIPKGLQMLFNKKGLSDIKEFTWWDREILNEVEITFVPAQHWSKRTLWDTNCSLWGGWVIKQSGGDPRGVYFAGDTGYFSGFKEVGRKFNISCMLAPIGAYEPEWFMCIQHMTPEEAVQAYLDTGAEYLIPMHYDAFRLGDDTPEEAITRLTAEWDRLKLDPDKRKIMKLGETIIPV